MLTSSPMNSIKVSIFSYVEAGAVDGLDAEAACSRDLGQQAGEITTGGWEFRPEIEI